MNRFYFLWLKMGVACIPHIFGICLICCHDDGADHYKGQRSIFISIILNSAQPSKAANRSHQTILYLPRHVHPKSSHDMLVLSQRPSSKNLSALHPSSLCPKKQRSSTSSIFHPIQRSPRHFLSQRPSLPGIPRLHHERSYPPQRIFP